MATSGWVLLLHAHDHVWRDRRVPLGDRLAACDAISELMIVQQRAARLRSLGIAP